MDSFSVVTKEDCLKILYKFAQNKYQFVDFEVIPFGSEPLGFLGEHSRLQITVNKNNKHKNLQFFMKTIPSDIDAHKEYVVNIGVFEKEAMLYKSLFSKLQSLSKNQFSPICYFVNTDSHIILEDLSVKGFAVIKDKSQTLDFAHCECLAKTIARFHAASIIFEEQNSSEMKPYRIYDHYKDVLFETTFSFVEGHARNDWLKTTVDALLTVSKKIDEYKNKDIATPLNNLIEAMKIHITPSKKYRNVINHGDLWSNNIMFKYNENSKPAECILVDFQMARYVPPCFDFLSFLYLTTTLDFHQKYFTDLLDIYYETFVSELKNHELNPDKILTKEQFVESCDEYKPAALLEAAMFGTIVYLNGDFSKDMLADSEKFDDFMRRDRSKLVCKLFDDDEVYRERLASVISQLLNRIL